MTQFGPLTSPSILGRTPLRTTLLVPFIIQTVLVVGITRGLALRNGQRSVNDLAQQLRAKTTVQVSYQVNDLLKETELLSDLIAASIQRESIDLSQVGDLEELYWDHLISFDFINGLGMGNMEGELIALFRQQLEGETTYFLEYSSSETGGDYVSSELDAQKQIIDSEVFDTRVDPRERPWYRAASAAGEPIWTETYPSVSKSSEQALLINFSRPIFAEDTGLQGVISAILDLGQISDFLQNVEITPSAQIYIVQPTGELIGSSDGETPISMQEEDLSQLNATDSSTPLIQASARYLNQEFGDDLSILNQAQQLEFIYEGEKHFLQVAPFSRSSGIEWLVVVVVPETDFMAQIHTGTRNTLLLGFTALGIVIILGVITSHWITRPMIHLSHVAADLSRGDFGQRAREDRGFKETRLLAQSFNSMALNLQNMFVSLERLNQDLEDRIKQRTAALQEREAHYRGLMEGASDAILVMDLQGQILEMNRKAEELLGYPREQLVGMPLTQIHPSEDQEDITTALLQIAQGERTQILNAQIQQRQGQVIPVDISATRVEIGDTSVIQGLFRDISDRKQVELTMIQNMEELQRLNLIKDDFLSTVSHELRSPLTNISMASRMLRIILEQQQVLSKDASTPEAERTNRYLTILQEQCKEEEDLINDQTQP